MEENKLNIQNSVTAEDGNGKGGSRGKTALKLINAAELGRKDIPPIQFLVDKMLAPGCCLLAGPHKGGKSYMALQLCLCVAGDEDFLGLPTEHGNCLYCALEDNERRLQSRTRQLQGGKEFPARLDFLLDVPKMGKGLEGKLESYVREYPDAKLIVIDTLALVRGEKRRGESDYDYDYRDMHALKAFADRHEICILLIHHMRKTKAEDVFDEIAGGVGIQAAADAIMTLQKKVRTDDDAVLHVAGRDIEADRFAILSDKQSRRWSLLGNSDYIKRQAYEGSPVVAALRKILDENGNFWSGTMTDLLDLGKHALGFEMAKSASALSREITKLKAELAEHDGIICSSRNPNGGANGRICEFRRIENGFDPAEGDDEKYFSSSDDGLDGGPC